MFSSNVARFPVERVMSSRLAEEIIGSMKTYGYPDFGVDEGFDHEEWVSKWIGGKFVLLGWDSVKRGVVRSFKDGRVRHMVRRVNARDSERRPRIETMCQLHEYPLWNWSDRKKVTAVPAVLLSPSQERYFALCKRCEMAIMKAGDMR